LTQSETPARFVRDLDQPVLRQHLAVEQVTEQRPYLVAFRAGNEEFGKRTVRLRDHEVVAVGSAAMRDYGNIVCRGHSADPQDFAQPSGPHHVRLQNVDRAAGDQLAEPITRVFVLAGGPLDLGMRRLQLLEAFPIIRLERFLDPLDPKLGNGIGKRDRVGHIKRQ
jgi:hypothetical protein